MALHFLDREDPSAKLGSALGSGLGSGLQALAEHKIGQLNQRQQEGAYYQILKQSKPNASPEELTQLSRSLSQLSPEDRKQFSKGLSQQLTGNDFQNNFLQELGIQSQAPAPQETQQLRQVEQPQVAPQQQPQRDEFTPPAPPILKPTGAELTQAKTPERELPKATIAPRIQENVSKKDNLVSIAKDLIQNGYPVPRDAKEKTELFKEAQKQLIEDRKLAFKERQLTSNETRAAFKATEDIRRESYAEERTANDRLEDLSRLEELETEGLDAPSTIEAYKNIGLDIPAFLNDPTQEANKIIQSFSRDIGKSFKGSISQFELEQFLNTIPSLLQSPEGRKRVVSSFKKMYRLKSEYGKQTRNIISENGGIPPLDLEEVREERMNPLREKIKKQFREDLKRKAPEGEDKFTAALKVGGSKLVGKTLEKAPSALAHAAAGAGIGSIAPGLGTAAGGILGGLYGLLK